MCPEPKSDDQATHDQINYVDYAAANGLQLRESRVAQLQSDQRCAESTRVSLMGPTRPVEPITFTKYLWRLNTPKTRLCRSFMSTTFEARQLSHIREQMTPVIVLQLQGLRPLDPGTATGSMG